MQPLCRLLARHRLVACAILSLALAMKLAIPVGFMPMVTDGTIVMRLCSGTAPMTMAVAIPGLEQDKPDGEAPQDKQAQPCAFSGLSAPTLAATDPILLALAILFVLVAGLRPLAVPVPRAPLHLRPPLRGPPTA